MKLIVKKEAFFMSLGLVAILLFLGPLTKLDRVSAQGGGQGGQTLGLGNSGGLGGLGLGSMMVPLGFNMAGVGGGMGSVNPLGLGYPTGVSGSVSMLGAIPGMTGGTIYGGSGLYGMYGGLFGMYGGVYGGMYGGLFGMYGGMYGGIGNLSPYSSLMAFPGQGYFVPGMPPQSEPIRGANTIFADALVPYFYGTGGTIFTPPLPYGITLHIDVVGYVFDTGTTYLPLEGVKVSPKYTSREYSETTGYNGRFVIELFPDKYTLVFSKEGYEDTEVENVRVSVGMKTLFVYMKMKNLNREPALNIPIIKVISGEEITLDPNVLIHDPDGDELSISYSKWNAEYWQAGSTYTTTEADMGLHAVEITFSDGKSSPRTETLMIFIYLGYRFDLYEGFNLISYPFEKGDPNFSAFDLMEELGGFSKIEAVAYYDNLSDQYITAAYDSNGNVISDEDFPIMIGQGYVLYAKEDIIEKRVINRYAGEGQDLDLYQGMNLVGIASCSEGYTSYDLLLDLRDKDVYSIYRYDPVWGDWESTYWLNGSPTGDIFPILKGEGYQVEIKEND